ncbi:MAG: alanine:cation symporter family protein [Oscillospiraceae bacterium]
MQAIISFITGTLNTVAWLYIFLPCTILFGLYLTIRNRGLQFTKFGYVMKNTLGKMFQKQEAGEGAVTPMQAVSTALAATVGTGNIVGTSQAIALGGYGAIFWLWLAALLGMMVKYSEVLLAIKYRERDAKGDWVGGPMYYVKNGLGKRLAVGRHLVLYLCSHRRFRYRQHVAGQLHRRLHQQRCRCVHPGRCC